MTESEKYMPGKENPKYQETKIIIDKTRNQIKEVPMGDVLLQVFDKFIDSSTIIIDEKTDSFDKYKNCILANVNNTKFGISLMIERSYDDAKLTILNTRTEYYSNYKRTVVLDELAYFLAGQKETGEKTFHPNDSQVTFGIKARVGTMLDGLALPSQRNDIVIGIAKAVSETAMSFYQVEQPKFWEERDKNILPLRK